MKAGVFEAKMRSLEQFHELRVPEGAFPIIRVDGRSFSRFTNDRFDKPFDDLFHDLMVETAQALMLETGGIYAYTESDEISVLLPHTSDYFGREVEKLVSISAAMASVTFSMAFDEKAVFDSRVCVAPGPAAVIDYFRWRQADAKRCALNGTCYWTLRKHGKTESEATEALHGLSNRPKLELLQQYGVQFDSLPAWQRLGTGVYIQHETRPGFNPLKGEVVEAVRRQLVVNLDLPERDAYAEWLQGLLEPEAESAG